MKTITIGLCCNDDRGCTDALYQVHIEDLLHLEGDFEDGEEIRFDVPLDPNENATVHINQVCYPISRHSKWVGNMAWDAVVMTTEDAARLVNHLRELPHWSVLEGVCELFEAFESKVEITAEMLEQHL